MDLFRNRINISYHCLIRMMLIPAIAMTVCISSCGSGNKDDGRMAQQGYVTESVTISRQYLDSIHNASDSATIARLMKEFDDALTKVNYKYPANLYEDITESENDTMTAVILAVVAARDSALYRLAHPAAPIDSAVLTQDSIPDSNIK